MRGNTKSKPLVVIQCYEDRQQTLPLRKADDHPGVTNGNGVHTQLKRDSQPQREASHNPPPPPPMPKPKSENKNVALKNGDYKNGEQKNLVDYKNGDYKNGDYKNSNINHQKPIDYNKSVKNGTLTRTPTPDYNNKTDVTQKFKNGKDDKAELDSLESYKLKNPSNVQPRPPSHYFVKAPNGTATMKKHVRPVSVTIGEYSTGGVHRREPSKLDFLNGDRPDGPDPEEPITNRLQSELALTLSRSNLRKKTEALGDAAA